MGLSITNNIASLTAQNNLNKTSGMLSKSLERLSSGLKINRGADGPAALVISEQQRAQIAGLQSAIANTSKAVAMVQTTEGALNEVSSMLSRMRELATQSANGSLSDNDRDTIDNEFQDIISEIDRVSTTTEFNDIQLLDGTSTLAAFQVGINSGSLGEGAAISLYLFPILVLVSVAMLFFARRAQVT